MGILCLEMRPSLRLSHKATTAVAVKTMQRMHPNECRASLSLQCAMSFIWSSIMSRTHHCPQRLSMDSMSSPPRTSRLTLPRVTTLSSSTRPGAVTAKTWPLPGNNSPNTLNDPKPVLKSPCGVAFDTVLRIVEKTCCCKRY